MMFGWLSWAADWASRWKRSRAPLVGAELAGDDLDRDVAAEHGVVGPEHLAHGALAELVDDLVLADLAELHAVPANRTTQEVWPAGRRRGPGPRIWSKLAASTPSRPMPRTLPARRNPDGPAERQREGRALDYLDAHLADFQAQLVALSRIPGVSAEPAPNEHLQRSAEATADVMRAAGIENVQILEIPGVHPYVYGDWLQQARARPTILLYGHHDVQPEGRPEKWISPPYEPTVRDGRLYGRGTADDKAGVMTHVAAVASYLKSTGELPLNVRFVIEGEEEIGSENLGKFLADLQAHAAGGLHRPLRHRELRHRHPRAHLPAARHLHDRRRPCRRSPSPVHSGMWGGPVPDPVQIMCRLIAGLAGQEGRDRRARALQAGREDPARRSSQRIRKLPFNEAKFKREARMMKGMKLAGEKGYSVYEQLWTRPVAHRDRLRRAPDQGLLEPDHRPRHARACRCAPCRTWTRRRRARRSSRS